MAVTIKSRQDIEGMRRSGRLLAEVHEVLHEAVRPGISTAELDELGEKAIRDRGGIPNCKDYEGYPASICISINEEVVHGIPRADRYLEEGDIVTFDTGMIVDGWHSDAARTWGVGFITPELQELIEVTEASFYEGIARARAGNHLYDISRAVSRHARSHGLGVVRDLTGHGIGRELHEDPNVPNYWKWTPGMKLRAGMTICVEPMLTLGTWRVGWLDDEWTVVTMDGEPAAHYENTIAITDGEPEILTIL